MSFLEKLDYLMIRRGLNKSTLSKESGIPYTTIDGFYKKGYENTKMSTIRKLSSFFEVTIDYLLDDSIDVMYKSVNSHSDSSDLSEDEKKLLADYRSLSASGKEYIRQTMAMAVQTFSGKNKAAPDMEAAN